VSTMEPSSREVIFSNARLLDVDYGASR